ncbi:sugar ABC transporter substrate-binding protein [Egicoccus halophilus]|uniref:Sugar ABC transporter substrate-binding protein n=2 Tax=Egicoccus halophilus TaxID=1670830 RepID=A0A8J3AD39_9ACTN|nr:extracellular solute-binding protein [Egicoccus halophilus]GGI09441.1 sugar ABC transporter substrate-binding protein [Egicoccus halophilus]
MAMALAATACGGGDEQVAPDGATTDGDEQAAGTDGDAEGTISLWHIQTEVADQALIDDAVARYEADNPGVDVDVTAIENDSYKTQIRVAVGANEAPCIFPSWGGGTLAEYVDAGQVVDLTDYVEQDGYRDRFVDAAWSVVEIDDRVYGVPVENSAAALVWYNRSLFEEQGLEPPQDWDELLEVVDAFNEAGIAPFALANQAPWTGSMYYMYIADRLGGPDTFAAAANRTGGSFEDPVFIEAGERLQELVERDAFASGFNGMDWDAGESRQLIYAGNAAMELMGNWNINIFRGENEQFFEENIGVTTFPAIEEGDGDPTNVVGTIGDNFYHVSSNCELQDEAFEVIQYLIDDESVEARVDNGRIPPVEGFEAEDEVTAEVFSILEQADSVQLWYDQFLPPELADVHLSTTQALFALSITPEEAAAQMEAAAVQYFGE